MGKRKLIILDMYGTIVNADKRDSIIRPGLQEFLAHYREHKRVVFTDAPAEVIKSDLQLVGLAESFDKVYDCTNCISETAYGMKNKKFRGLLMRNGGGNIKNLEQACRDFHILKSNAVFIGDNDYGKDQKSAEFHRIRFIRVPQFRQDPPSWVEQDSIRDYVEYENPASHFSFTSLIGKI